MLKHLYLAGPRPSYFNSVVNASMRKEVLIDIPSKDGDRLFTSNITAVDTFQHYDLDNNGRITIREFNELLIDLFRDGYGNPYYIEAQTAYELYSIFTKRDVLGFGEFQKCWNCWIKTILRPVSAILVIDVQNDFITGPLAIKDFPAQEDGVDVVPQINQLLDSTPFDNIFYSQEWHPTDHISFIDNLGLPGREFSEDSLIKNKNDVELFSEVVFKGPPKTKVTIKPRNCVQGSEGAKFHRNLKVHELGIIVQKGANSKIDSYSAFFDNEKLIKTELDDKLKQKGVTDVYICGLPTDEGVSNTSHDALNLGYRTILIQDASKGKYPNFITKTKKSIKMKRGLVVESIEVKEIVQGLNRPVELGYSKALQCKTK